ncbi:TerC family protein [Oleiharenicola lentus]|uniref:TerC family protein n=2 Tax=Oleiharenicola lentus TaxID=2508720 RepID=A0A4Q1CCL6_9BACT|nr:TerC family protein [Oleiharenicola lentus]
MFSAMPWWAWAGFLVFITAMLALDLGVFNRKAHEVSLKEALTWCGVWFALAMAFNLLVALKMPATEASKPALEFFTGYLIELCLSVDNVFVFIVIFQYFRVEPRYQHRVLFWGIIGAVVMRAIFIFAGVSLINKFHWIIYVFGAFLIYTGIKLAQPKKEDGFDPEKNPAVKLARKVMPVTNQFDGGNFFTRVGGKLHATPMFLVLLIVETTDVMFALDSIPAVIAITRNEFIIFTSNIFAILGLRSLYFAVSGVMKLFRFINIGLSVILVFVGCKMLATYFSFHVPIGWSLSFIATVLAASILASVLIPVKVPKSP